MQAVLPFGPMISTPPSATSTIYYEAARKLLIYRTDAADKITATIPAAKALGDNYVAVPPTVPNLQLLRWLGHNVPPILDTDYDWPRNKTMVPAPFEAQRVTANFLVVHSRAFVFNDMGTGKTLALLWGADYMMQQNPGMKVLIIAPLATLQRVWATALFNHFTGRRSGVVLHGDAKKRRALLANEHDFYIINFDGLPVIAKELEKRKDVALVIVDEAAAYRDSTTERHKLARKVLVPRPYIWLATGTPTPHGPTDAYGLAKIVNNAYGETWSSYHSRVMTRLAQFKWVPKPGAHETAKRLLQPAVRFSIEQCVDLPPCTTQMRDVELSDEQKHAYDRMKRDLQLIMKSGKKIDAFNEGVMRLKLIQIACGAIYGEERSVHLVDCAPRLAAVRDLVEACEHKVVLFAPLTSVLHLLYKELSKQYECVLIRGRSNGGPTKKDNDAALLSFSKPGGARIALCNPETVAQGVNDLVTATLMIWYAPTDKNLIYRQGVKRIDRPGQVHKTTVVQLASTPIEREIYRRLDANETMQGLILQLAR